MKSRYFIPRASAGIVPSVGGFRFFMGLACDERKITGLGGE